MSDVDIAPMRVDELVFAEVYDVKTGAYVSVHALVKGRWKVCYSTRYPYLVAVELRWDVGDGTMYRAQDVVVLPVEQVSRSSSDAVMSVGSEFTEAHTAGLPEVRVHRYRLVPEEAAHGS